MNISQLASLVKQENTPNIEQFQRVALSVSGGIDSTALFHVFLQFAKKKYFSDLILLHVNYGLRGKESDLDEVFVRTLARDSGLECRVISFRKQKSRFERLKRESTQVWARRIRHHWYEEIAAEGYKIALAHNANDVAENVILRIARGTKELNLGGMGHVDGVLWRPLLGIPRQTISKAMAGSRKTWREDSSNSKPDYPRNRIRHEVMPILEQIYPGASDRMAKWSFWTEQTKNMGDKVNDNDALNKKLAGVQREGSHRRIAAVSQFMKDRPFNKALSLGDSLWLVCSNHADQAPLIPTIRESQHLATLDAREYGLILTGKSSYIEGAGLLALRVVRSDGSLSEASFEFDGAVQVDRPTSTSKVRIAGLVGSFSFTELMQKWKIPVIDRCYYVLVSSGRQVLVLCRMTPRSGIGMT